MMMARLAWEEEAAPMLRQLELVGREPVAKEREVLDREPVNDPDVALAMDALHTASTCRALGYGVVGPVPQSAIDAWCDRRGFDLDSAEYLSAAIRYVDGVRMAKAADLRRQNGG